MSYCRQEGKSGAAMDTGPARACERHAVGWFPQGGRGFFVGLTRRFPDEKVEAP